MNVTWTKMNRFYMIISFLAVMVISGCAPQETTLPIEDHNLIYLFDAGNDQLKPVLYGKNPEELIPNELAEDIVGYLKTGVKGSTYEPSVESGLEVEQVNVLGNSVFINFNIDYYLMPPIKELQTRTAIVRSLTSFDTFKEVEFFVGSKPLIFDGIEIGRMSKHDVLLTFDESLEGNEYQNATIYYPDPEIEKLVETDVVIDIAPDRKIEEIIIDQLRRGDDQVLPPYVELLNVYTHNGICFIDFSSEFLTMPIKEGLNERLVVYAIVNSLVELDHVSTVQILINGNVVSDFKGNFSMNRLFEKNYSLIYHENN